MSVIAVSLALTKYLPMLVSYPTEYLIQGPKPSGTQYTLDKDDGMNNSHAAQLR